MYLSDAASVEGFVRIRTPLVAVTVAICPDLKLTGGAAGLGVDVGAGVSVAGAGLAAGAGTAVGSFVVAGTGAVVAVGELALMAGDPEDAGVDGVPVAQPASVATSSRNVSLDRPLIDTVSVPGRRG